MNKYAFVLYHVLIGVIIILIYVILSKRFGWVASKEGEYCYVIGHVPKSVDYPIYFNSLEKCERFVDMNN